MTLLNKLRILVAQRRDKIRNPGLEPTAFSSPLLIEVSSRRG